MVSMSGEHSWRSSDTELRATARNHKGPGVLGTGPSFWGSRTRTESRHVGLVQFRTGLYCWLDDQCGP